MNRRILQIIPATGWNSVYDVDGEFKEWALACFALVEEEDGDGTLQQYVAPMGVSDGEVDFCDKDDNFFSLSHETDKEDDNKPHRA